MSSKKYRKINKVLSIIQMVLLAAIVVALIVLIALGVQLLTGKLKEKNAAVSAERPAVICEMAAHDAAGAASF